MSFRNLAAAASLALSLSAAAAEAASVFEVRLFNVGGLTEVTLTDGVDTWSGIGSAVLGDDLIVDLTPFVTTSVDYTVFVSLYNDGFTTFPSYGWELLLDGVIADGATCGDLATLTPCLDLDLSTQGYVYDGFATFSGVVPEPATWLLLIGGFGGVGAALRRKSVARLAADRA